MLGPVTAQYADLVGALSTRGPHEARAYTEIIAGAALSHPSPLITPERLAWVITGIGLRETGWGTSDDLDQLGPGGTGDRGARHRRPERNRFRIPPIYQGVSNIPDEHGRVWVLPLDGRGWGRGLLQLDWEMHPELVEQLLPDGSPAWANAPWNIEAGTGVFMEVLHQVADERQAIAGFNCGAAGVRAALTAGQDIDIHTTGGNYSRWVLERLEAWGAPKGSA